MIYGIDLVRWQMEVARGVPLRRLLPEGVDPMEFALHPAGHAIEVRVYAEDPAQHFLPAIGRIVRWQSPPLVRTDAGIRSGDSITTHYDPLVAKIIAHGETRTEAIRRLEYALQQTQLLGLRNNIAFLRRVLLNHEHLAGIISTRFLDEHADLLVETAAVPPLALIAAAVAKQSYTQHWRNNAHRPVKHTFLDGTTPHEVLITPQPDGTLRVRCGDLNPVVVLRHAHDGDLILRVNGHQQRVTALEAEDNHWWVQTPEAAYHLRWQTPLPAPALSAESAGSLRAPMPGQVIRVAVATGQAVAKGMLLLIIEAMKMEHRIEAPYSGTITALHYQAGDTVAQDAILLALQPED
jgi:acetyl/propionyl-CoA carboxylase alpha subunit